MRRETSEGAFWGGENSYDREIQQWLVTWMGVWTQRLIGLGCFAAPNASGFAPNYETPGGRFRIDSIKYRTPQGRREIMEITLSYGQWWKPVITVSGTHSNPVAVDLGGDPGEDMARIKEQVLLCFERAGIDMREPFVGHNLPASRSRPFVSRS